MVVLPRASAKHLGNPKTLYFARFVEPDEEGRELLARFRDEVEDVSEDAGFPVVVAAGAGSGQNCFFQLSAPD